MNASQLRAILGQVPLPERLMCKGLLSSFMHLRVIPCFSALWRSDSQLVTHTNLSLRLLVPIYSNNMACHIVSHFDALQLDQLTSSDDDFHTARESSVSSINTSSPLSDSAPGTAANPIMVDDGSRVHQAYSSEDADNKDSIPTPKTRDSNGNNLEWDSLDTTFNALQDFAKENGFIVKKHTRKLKGTHVYIQYINCVRGGQRNIIKVSTLNRKRKSRSLISDDPCQFRACLKE